MNGFMSLLWERVHYQESGFVTGHQWLTPIILATQEAEIRRIMVQSQTWQIVHETLS
jgi:hypothetical protein